MACLSFPAFAQPPDFDYEDWRHMESENFQIYASTNERNARTALEYFERVRTFFLQLTGEEVDSPNPVVIVHFNSEKEFEPYKVQIADAYFVEAAARDYIVLGRPGEQIAQTAVHEYVNLIARHSELRFPLWLSEGFAEFYSTFATQGDNVLVGRIIPGRVQAMRNQPWVPIEEILRADRESEFYSDEEKASALYSEAWALVHMIATTQKYGDLFAAMLGALAEGGDSVAVLEQLLGKSVDEIDSELRLYVRDPDGMDRVLLYPLKLESSGEKYESVPAEPFDVDLALADLTLITRGPDAARPQYQRLTEIAPDRPESFSGLGYAGYMLGDREIAVDHFAKAFELGERHPRLLLDFGRAGMGSRTEEATRALRVLSIQQPDNVEVAITLARAELVGGDVQGSLRALRAVTKVSE